MAESGPWEKYQSGGESGPWSKYQPAESTPEPATSEPGPSDEIPLSSAQNATASGVQSVGRGIAGAATGLMKQFAPPEGVGENLAVGLGGPIGVAAYRGMKGLGETVHQATQLPAAIKDINASPDPLGTYAKAAQETAGQGAGQALVGLGTEGMGRIAPRVPFGKIARVGAEALPVVGPGIGRFMEGMKGPEVGAHSNIVVRPGPDVTPREMMPKIGATQRIPVRPGMEPIGAGSAAEGGGQISEPATSLIPEPRAPFPGENPNYAASIPREELEGLAKIGKPGAGTQLQQLGGVHGRPVLYIPREAEFPTSVRARQILNEFGQPVDQSSTVERIEPIRKKRAENE